MLCSRVQKLLSAYCDSELTGIDTLRVRNHLDRCPGCREELGSVRQIKQLLGSLRSIEPPEPFDRGLLDHPHSHVFWLRRAAGVLHLDGFGVRLRTVLGRGSAALLRAVLSPGNLALAGVALLLVLSAAVLQRPQPSDAVSARVPGYVAPDSPVDEGAEALTPLVPQPEPVVGPFSRVQPSFLPVSAAPRFVPVNTSLAGAVWRTR
jgi:anti-sigma factor RsiW